MTKTEIARRLHEMVDERLFGSKPWPVNSASDSKSLPAALIEMGLCESVPGREHQEWRFTPLGVELDIDLLTVFMGYHEPAEMPILLWTRGLMDDEEVDQLCYAKNFERKLKQRVRRAYMMLYNPRGSLN
jgi:hypothetical protein